MDNKYMNMNILTYLPMSEIKWRNNILLGRDDNTLSSGLLSVEYCMLHFPDVPLVPTQYNKWFYPMKKTNNFYEFKLIQSYVAANKISLTRSHLKFTSVRNGSFHESFYNSIL